VSTAKYLSIMLTSVAIACGDGEYEDSSGSTDPEDTQDAGNDTETSEEEGTGSQTEDSIEHTIWEDEESGLFWIDPPAANGMSLSEAETYCQALEIDDLDDWRLPDIGELRSLIRGCSQTEASGTCAVVDGVGSDDSGIDCSGCEKYQGPDPEVGCYWDSAIEGPCAYYWSASPDADVSGNAWSVFFVEGAVTSQREDLLYQVRCVRGPA
jgi:hypothetical protein